MDERVSHYLFLSPVSAKTRLVFRPGQFPLLDPNLGTLLTRLRQVLDPLVNYFADRLEELDARVRQVLPYPGRNTQARPEEV